MANKLTGELRLDLSQPVTAEDLAELLGELDEFDVDRAKTIVTLQPTIEHHGGGHAPRIAGMQLVATWSV